MILPLLLAAVAFAALLPVILPLLRGAPDAVERGRYDQAVYRDQLRELERDVARGVVSPEEAQGARLEIQRRLLAADAIPAGAVRLTRSPVLAAVVAVLVAGGSVAIYTMIGAPSVPDEPFASRSAAGPAQMAGGPPDLQQAVSRLAETLKADPTNRDGWLLYARTNAMLSRWDAAADAYRRAITLGAKGSPVLAGYGEVLVMQAQGIVTPTAHDAFARVLQDEPGNEVARYYLALAAGQAGEGGKAIDQLQGLLADLPADSPMREEIGRRIQEAAKSAGIPEPKLAQGKPAVSRPGPDAEAMAAAAAMPEAERRTMIEGMVARLAVRLQAEPGDLDGWLRLGRAYAVLGQRDKAADAFERAAALKPADAAIRLQAVDALMEGLTPADPLPPRAIALLHQIEATDPEEPGALWYLGLAAVHDRHFEAANRYWTRLLGKLPPDGQEAKMVKAALQALQGG